MCKWINPVVKTKTHNWTVHDMRICTECGRVQMKLGLFWKDYNFDRAMGIIKNAIWKREREEEELMKSREKALEYIRNINK